MRSDETRSVTIAARKREFRWERLPYGQWTCGAGRKVIFNRRYKLLMSRHPGSEAVLADRNEWVEGIEQNKTIFFYDDGTPEMDKARNANRALSAFKRGILD